MSRPTIVVVDAITKEEIVRELTDEEMKNFGYDIVDSEEVFSAIEG